MNRDAFGLADAATGEPIFLDGEQYNEDGYEPHLYDAIVDADGTMTIAGEFGLILRSTDGGTTWNPRSLPEPRSSRKKETPMRIEL